jgi:ABC-2 type transport system permease protein
MQEGEKLSSRIYDEHRKALLERYQNQNSFNRYTAFINPYIAVKNLSMALTGSDFASYLDFQDQAEKFRYNLAQRINGLQIKHISNKKQGERDNPYSISKKHWEETPDFKYVVKDKSFVFQNEKLSIAALWFWLILPFALLFTLTRNFKSI